MLKAFLSFLALAVVLVTVSFAGLIFTGMASMDSMNHSFSTTDISCLDHCLSVASNQTSAVTPISLSLIALLVFVLLLAFSNLPTTNYRLLTLPPWRQAIGKLLRQRQLATVLIRD